MNFIPALAIRFRIANSCTRWQGIYKRLSQDGGRADFSKNLLAFLFNKDLSKELLISVKSIHLDSTFKDTTPCDTVRVKWSHM
jgi:hypothetical protein